MLASCLRSHVASQISRREGSCVLFILPGKCQQLIPNGRVVGKGRCRGQRDLGLPAWALVGHPARRCHCRKAHSLVGFGFYLDGSPATFSGHRLKELPGFCSDRCSLCRSRPSVQGLLGVPSLHGGASPACSFRPASH